MSLTSITWILRPETGVLFSGHARALGLPGTAGGRGCAQWLPFGFEFLFVRRLEL